MSLIQKREKDERRADFCEVEPKEEAIEQFVDLGSLFL